MATDYWWSLTSGRRGWVVEERIPFRGGLTCICVVKSLPLVEADLQRRGLLSGPLRIFQLGYREDVDASKATHARGGCTDVDGTPTAAEIDVWRLWGWTMQARYLRDVPPHCHGWPYKCSHLSAAAQLQEEDWDRRDAGLQGESTVQGRWPVLPWHEALALNTKLGVPPLMTIAERIPDINFDGKQLLEPGVEQHVWINDKQHVSIIDEPSAGIDLRATITVSGLKAGERVQLYFHKQWRGKAALKTIHKGYDDSVYIYAGGPPSVHFTFAGHLSKADAGWTAVIRIGVKTNSETAVITKRQIRGWRLT
jgi:hypothetical protein